MLTSRLPLMEAVEGRTLLSAGQLDISFGQAGVVAATVSAFSANAVVVQGDGKILVAGSVRQTGTANQSDFALARYNADGTPDATFGGGGMVVTDLGGQDEKAHAVAIQADGRIVVAGETTLIANQSSSDFAVVRYNADGSLDESFGLSGIRIIDFHESGDVAYSVAVTGDGAILAAGSAGMGPTRTDFAMVRLAADGSLDEGFGVAGKVTTDFDGNYDAASAVAISPEGSILLAGSSGKYWRFYRGITLKSRFAGAIAVARYGPDGSLDTSFDGDGKTTVTSPFGMAATAALLLGDGKIVLGGQHWRETSGSDPAIVRLNSDGSLDSTFGGTGMVWTTVGDQGRVNALLRQPDGRVIAAGVAAPATLDWESPALIRYEANGTLDTTFGIRGIASSGALPTLGITALADQGNRRVIAAGLNSSTETMLLRIDATAPQPFATLSGGILSAGGTASSDTLRIESNGQRITASLNTDPSIIFNAAEVRRIAVATGDGGDTVTIRAGTLPSVVRAGAGDDVVLGGAGRDTVFGGDGQDRIHGGTGDDDLRGEGGNDLLYGDDGRDRLVGGAGQDILNGGNGDDVLIAADHQRDILRGGRGRDVARKDRFDVLSSVER